MEGLRRLKRSKTLFGVATTVTGQNFEEVLSDEYVRTFIDRGAMYLWYYVFRPVGRDPSPRFCVSRERMIELRRRLLGLRRRTRSSSSTPIGMPREKRFAQPPRG